MSKQMFNKYGVVLDETLLQLDDQIFKLVSAYVKQKVKDDDITLGEVRAICQVVCSSVNVACSEAMLRAAMHIRKQERTQ